MRPLDHPRSKGTPHMDQAACTRVSQHVCDVEAIDPTANQSPYVQQQPLQEAIDQMNCPHHAQRHHSTYTLTRRPSIKPLAHRVHLYRRHHDTMPPF